MKLLAAYSPGSNRLQADLSERYSDRGPLLLLMRHGRVDTGPGRLFLGQTDLPLDRTGRSQARAWIPELGRIPLSQVYVSALGRARETAALCCPHRDALVDARLNEIHLGAWDGLCFDHIRTRFPDAFQQRGRDIYGYRTPDGESFQDVCSRAAAFFEDLKSAIQREPGHALVITHAGVIRTLCCHWAGKPMDRLFDYTPGYGEIWVLAAGKGQPWRFPGRPVPVPPGG